MTAFKAICHVIDWPRYESKSMPGTLLYSSTAQGLTAAWACGALSVQSFRRHHDVDSDGTRRTLFGENGASQCSHPYRVKTAQGCYFQPTTETKPCVASPATALKSCTC